MVVSLSRMIVTLITCVLTSGLLAAGDPHTNDSFHDSLVTAWSPSPPTNGHSMSGPTQGLVVNTTSGVLQERLNILQTFC